MNTTELLFKDECYAIMGACFEVYNEKGCGFLEAVYHECLTIELGLQQIPFETKPKLRLFYKGRPLEQSYQADIICYQKVLVEIKAASGLDDGHRAQVHNYLRATDLRLGLLANFGHYPKLQWERIIR